MLSRSAAALIRMNPQPKLARNHDRVAPITEPRLSVPMIPHREKASEIPTAPQKTTGSTPFISRDMPSPLPGPPGRERVEQQVAQISPAGGEAVNSREARPPLAPDLLGDLDDEPQLGRLLLAR